MTRPYERVVVIGASSGGVTALLQISEQLPPAFPAPVCVAQHIGANPSLLPELLRYRGPNPAMHAEDGQALEAGMLHVAPPDRHLLLQRDTLVLSHGPKENHARPAIDPLFRSAALAFGPRVIGVVLTGQMDDGTAGARAIKDCGGTIIVQDPATAAEPQMPASVLANVPVDHCVPLPEIAPLLARLAGAPVTDARAPEPPLEVVREVAINTRGGSMEQLVGIAVPSPLTCPDCGGGLWEMKESRPLRYRCHTGHAYTSLSLAQAQHGAAEQAMWAAVRALREREMLLRRMAGVARTLGDDAQANAATGQADRLQRQVEDLQRMAEATPSVPEFDAAA
jgi:two-component system chemotaxis response regulator CheB